jgi:hypothetical protein
MDLIIENVYLGDINGASNMAMLKKNVSRHNMMIG